MKTVKTISSTDLYDLCNSLTDIRCELMSSTTAISADSMEILRLCGQGTAGDSITTLHCEEGLEWMIDGRKPFNPVQVEFLFSIVNRLFADVNVFFRLSSTLCEVLETCQDTFGMALLSDYNTEQKTVFELVS